MGIHSVTLSIGNLQIYILVCIYTFDKGWIQMSVGSPATAMP